MMGIEDMNYEELLMKEDMSESNKDYLNDAQSLTRHGMQLSTFKGDFAIIDAKVDLLSKLLGAHAKRRALIVKQLKKREKDDDFKQQYRDRNMVDREDYDTVMSLFELDQDIIPLQVILAKLAIHGFKEVGSLVDTEVTLKESKIFTTQMEKMLTNSYSEMLKVIDNNKLIIDSILNDYKKRADDNIKEINSQLNDIAKATVKSSVLISTLTRRMDDLNTSDRQQNTKLFSSYNQPRYYNNQQQIDDDNLIENIKKKSITEKKSILHDDDSGSDSIKDMRKKASESLLKRLEEEDAAKKSNTESISKNTPEIGHTFDDVIAKEPLTSGQKKVFGEVKKPIEAEPSTEINRTAELQKFIEDWKKQYGSFAGLAGMLRKKYKPTESELAMVADFKTLLNIKAYKERQKQAKIDKMSDKQFEKTLDIDDTEKQDDLSDDEDKTDSED